MLFQVLHPTKSASQNGAFPPITCLFLCVCVCVCFFFFFFFFAHSFCVFIHPLIKHGRGVMLFTNCQPSLSLSLSSKSTLTDQQAIGTAMSTIHTVLTRKRKKVCSDQSVFDIQSACKKKNTATHFQVVQLFFFFFLIFWKQPTVHDTQWCLIFYY